jgi:hypothetical protein
MADHEGDDNDDDDNNSNYDSIVYLFICLLNCPKANYKVSTSKESNQRNTHTKRRKARQR